MTESLQMSQPAADSPTDSNYELNSASLWINHLLQKSSTIPTDSSVPSIATVFRALNTASFLPHSSTVTVPFPTNVPSADNAANAISASTSAITLLRPSLQPHVTLPAITASSSPSSSFTASNHHGSTPSPTPAYLVTTLPPRLPASTLTPASETFSDVYIHIGHNSRGNNCTLHALGANTWSFRQRREFVRRLAIIVILIMKQRSKQISAPGGGGLYDGHHNVRRVVRFNTEAYQAALSIPQIQGVNLTGPFRSTKEYLLAQLTKVICFYETLDMKHWEELIPPLMLERWEEDDYNAAADGKVSKARRIQAKTRLLAYLKCLKGFVEESRFDTPFLQSSLPGKQKIDNEFFLHHPGLMDGSCLLMDGTDLVSITGWENTKYVSYATALAGLLGRIQAKTTERRNRAMMDSDEKIPELWLDAPDVFLDTLRKYVAKASTPAERRKRRERDQEDTYSVSSRESKETAPGKLESGNGCEKKKKRKKKKKSSAASDEEGLRPVPAAFADGREKRRLLKRSSDPRSDSTGPGERTESLRYRLPDYDGIVRPPPEKNRKRTLADYLSNTDTLDFTAPLRPKKKAFYYGRRTILTDGYLQDRCNDPYFLDPILPSDLLYGDSLSASDPLSPLAFTAHHSSLPAFTPRFKSASDTPAILEKIHPVTPYQHRLSIEEPYLPILHIPLQERGNWFLPSVARLVVEYFEDHEEMNREDAWEMWEEGVVGLGIGEVEGWIRPGDEALWGVRKGVQGGRWEEWRERMWWEGRKEAEEKGGARKRRREKVLY